MNDLVKPPGGARRAWSEMQSFDGMAASVSKAAGLLEAYESATLTPHVPPLAREHVTVANAQGTARVARARRHRCLLIDSDSIRRRGNRKYLSMFALDACVAESPRAARTCMERECFDAIILHQPPGADGLALLRWLRESYTGPLLLVGRFDESSKIVALETGASDVLEDACSRREVVARARALLRLHVAPDRSVETQHPARTSLLFHDLKLDLVFCRLTNDSRGSALLLGQTEYRLLCCLLLAEGDTLTREALAASVYERQGRVERRTIDVAVSRLRSAINSMSNVKDILVTVRGEGYRIATTSASPA